MSTIAAAATPTGGAISIIRISGEDTLGLMKRLCGIDFVPRRAHCVSIDTGTLKDRCIAIFYEAKSSFTGEDSGEIFCHGSRIIVEEILRFLVRNGARYAERGEFTMRAYLNKRLDLTEAEGVLDLVNAETVEQANSAFLAAEGSLRRTISGLQDRLRSLIASVEVAIDYPEENIEETTMEAAKASAAALNEEIGALISSFGDGRKIKEGVRVVISGAPNVGKSSLFNALLGSKRAIVNAEAGTTRDVIECDYVYKGRKFVLVDTAGLREAEGEVEREGITLAREELGRADLILGVGTAKCEHGVGKNVLVVTNKCDMGRGKGLNVSALTGEGVEALKEEIYKLTDFSPKGATVNNMRQYEALKSAQLALTRACENSLSVDCFAVDLTDAYNSLGKVTGVIGSDEIIAEIFSAFCVGK